MAGSDEVQSTPAIIKTTNHDTPANNWQNLQNFSTPKEDLPDTAIGVENTSKRYELEPEQDSLVSGKNEPEDLYSFRSVLLPPCDSAIVSWSKGEPCKEWDDKVANILGNRILEILNCIEPVALKEWKPIEIVPKSYIVQGSSAAQISATNKRRCVLAHPGYSVPLLQPTVLFGEAECAAKKSSIIYANKELFNLQRQELLEQLNKLAAPPFTLQRLCEVLVEPTRGYSNTWKLVRGIYKLLTLADFPLQFLEFKLSEQNEISPAKDSKPVYLKLSVESTPIKQ